MDIAPARHPNIGVCIAHSEGTTRTKGAIVITLQTERTRAGNGARMLDRAEGILVGLRRCTVDAAFGEIIGASRRHTVPALRVAQALVELAEGRPPRDDDAAWVVRTEWSTLFPEGGGPTE
jgi:hypothetical protein